MALDERERRLLAEMKRAASRMERAQDEAGKQESGLDPEKQKDAPGVDSEGHPYPVSSKPDR